MSSIAGEISFGFKWLSSIDGIEKKTINVLLANGYHSVKDLVTVKFETDLYPIPDILLAQKSILREAINELQSEYRQMKTKPNNDKTVTRRLLEEFLIDGNANINTNMAPNETLVSSSITTSSDITSRTKPPKVRRRRKQRSPRKVVKTLPDSQSPFARKLGLRSAKKRSLKKNSPTNGKPIASTPILGPKVVLTEDKSKCGVCGDFAKFKGVIAPYCDPCPIFYRNRKKSNKQFVCEYDGNCRITLKTRNDCQGCRWSRCRQLIEKLVDSSNASIVQQSANGSTIVLNTSDSSNGKKQ